MIVFATVLASVVIVNGERSLGPEPESCLACLIFWRFGLGDRLDFAWSASSLSASPARARKRVLRAIRVRSQADALSLWQFFYVDPWLRGC